VICFDNFDPFYDPNIKMRHVGDSEEVSGTLTCDRDITNEEHLGEVFKKSKVGLVVHLAAKAGVRPSIAEPLVYQDVNVRGTVCLLEACRVNDVPQVVFASSSSVYGENQRVPFSEKDLDIQPISPYGATKRTGEVLGYTYHHLYDMDMACLRIFTAYGPRQRPEMAIHKFVRLIDCGEKIPLYGDGSSMRDYTYIDDLIDGILAVIRKSKGYEIYNLGESQTTSLKELIVLIENTLGMRAKIDPHEAQPGDVSATYADITGQKKN
jgi:UDP-glucuronate 4-epimerase